MGAVLLMQTPVLGLALASIYCVVRAIVDVRERRFAWAAVGFASSLALALAPVPIQTHAVKIDLPVNEVR